MEPFLGFVCGLGILFEQLFMNRADAFPTELVVRLGGVDFPTGSPGMCVSFSPDQKRVLASCRGGSVSIWSIDDGKELWVGRDDETEIRAARFSPDGKRIVGAGTELCVWDAVSYKKISQVGSVYGVKCLAFSPDRSRMAVGGRNGKVSICDTKDGSLLLEFGKHESEVTSICYEGRAHVISGSRDGSVRRWNTADGKEMDRWSPSLGEILAVACSKDGKFAAWAGGEWLRKDSYAISLWDLRRKVRVYSLRGHRALVTGIQFSADGSKLFSCSLDGTVRLWDVASGGESDIVAEQLLGFRGLVVSDDGTLLAATGDNCSIRIWEAQTFRQLTRTRGHTGPVCSLALTSNSRFLVSGGEDGVAILWRVDKGQKVRILGSHQATVGAVALSADAQSAITVSRDVRQWDELSTHSHSGYRRILTGILTPFIESQVAIASSEPVVAGECIDHVVRAYRLGDMTCSCEIARQHDLAILGLSPDGRFVVTVHRGDTLNRQDTKVRVWETRNGSMAKAWTERANAPTAMAIGPGGRVIALSSEEGTISIHRLATNAVVKEFKGCALPITSLAFAPDGRSLAAGDAKGVIRLFEIASCQERSRLAAHRGAITCLLFSDDGMNVVSGSQDSSIVFWRAWKATGVAAVQRDRGLEDSVGRDDRTWRLLGGSDAAEAYSVMSELVSTPDYAVALANKRLNIDRCPPSEQVEVLLKDCEAREFAARERATVELERVAHCIESRLRSEFERAGGEKKRRLERILASTEANYPARLREGRWLEVLERIQREDARKVIERISLGPPDARITKEAVWALRRFAQIRPGPK